MSAEPRQLPAAYAAVVFKGELLDPELVSAIMETPPTLSYKRGDGYTVNGKVLERRFGLWVYSTRNVINSSSLKKHLEILENLIIGVRSSWPDRRVSKIREMIKSQNIQFRVDVFWFGASEAEIPKVSLSFKYLVEEAGGTVETDFHRYGDKTEAA